VSNDSAEHLTTQLLALTGNPRRGLPTPVFHLVSQLTPLINVDLLIRDTEGRTLLTWRADEFYGPGWHIPGGIIRFKENIATRIAKVAENELGCTVDSDPAPLTMREIMAPHRDVRGHFISLLYRCRLRTPPAPELAAGSPPQAGQWQWHEHCPDDLIRVHDMYRPWIAPTLPEAA
jgi:colanic acid biosynthesis protein WcaH